MPFRCLRVVTPGVPLCLVGGLDIDIFRKGSSLVFAPCSSVFLGFLANIFLFTFFTGRRLPACLVPQCGPSTPYGLAILKQPLTLLESIVYINSDTYHCLSAYAIISKTNHHRYQYKAKSTWFEIYKKYTKVYTLSMTYIVYLLTVHTCEPFFLALAIFFCFSDYLYRYNETI